MTDLCAPAGAPSSEVTTPGCCNLEKHT